MEKPMNKYGFILRVCYKANSCVNYATKYKSRQFMSPVSLILHIKSTVNSCPQLLLLERNCPL